MSYGRGFKKKKGTKSYRDKKTGRYTSERYLKASRTMQKIYGGKFGEWNRKLEEHYSRMRSWERGDREIEPILEYE